MCFSMSFVIEVAGIVSEAILKWELVVFSDEILVFGEIFLLFTSLKEIERDIFREKFFSKILNTLDEHLH